MAINYLTYPTKVMNISQSYWASYSHAKHNTGSPKDYPIDECCEDSGRSWFYCPCDGMVIKHIYGVGTGGTNTIWMTSTSQVVTPSGSCIVSIMVEHPNDDDLSGLYEGQTFSRGQKMFREGTDGWATGNHFHISVGAGSLSDPSTGWTENSNGAWVINTTNGPLKPQSAFYVNTDFTSIYNDEGISFQTITSADLNSAGGSGEGSGGGSGEGSGGSGGSEPPPAPKIVNYNIFNNEVNENIARSANITAGESIVLPNYAAKLETKKCIGITDTANQLYALGTVIPTNDSMDGQTLNYEYKYRNKETEIYIYDENFAFGWDLIR